MLLQLALAAGLEGNPFVLSGNNRPFCLPAIPSANWRNQHCNRRGKKSCQEEPLVPVGAGVAQPQASEAVAA